MRTDCRRLLCLEVSVDNKDSFDVDSVRISRRRDALASWTGVLEDSDSAPEALGSSIKYDLALRLWPEFTDSAVEESSSKKSRLGFRRWPDRCMELSSAKAPLGFRWFSECTDSLAEATESSSNKSFLEFRLRRPLVDSESLPIWRLFRFRVPPSKSLWLSPFRLLADTRNFVLVCLPSVTCSDPYSMSSMRIWVKTCGYTSKEDSISPMKLPCSLLRARTLFFILANRTVQPP